MSADLLRRAVETLRERAGATTPGEWSYMGGSVLAIDANPLRPYALVASGDDQDSRCDGNVIYIATMHPGVALALADWIEPHARDLASAGGHLPSTDSPGDVEHAIAIARLLDEQS